MHRVSFQNVLHATISFKYVISIYSYVNKACNDDDAAYDTSKHTFFSPSTEPNADLLVVFLSVLEDARELDVIKVAVLDWSLLIHLVHLCTHAQLKL